MTGEQALEETDPVAEDGDEVAERLDGDGDRDDGIARSRFGLDSSPLLLRALFAESLSIPVSEHSDSLSVSLLLRFL